MKLTEKKLRIIIKQNLSKIISEKTEVEEVPNNIIDTRQGEQEIKSYLKSLKELKDMYNLEQAYREKTHESWPGILAIMNAGVRHLNDETTYINNKMADTMITVYDDYVANSQDSYIEYWTGSYDNWVDNLIYEEGQAKCQDEKNYLYSMVIAFWPSGIQSKGHDLARAMQSGDASNPTRIFKNINIIKKALKRIERLKIDPSMLQPGINYTDDPDAIPLESDRKDDEPLSRGGKASIVDEIINKGRSYIEVNNAHSAAMENLSKKLNRRLYLNRMKDMKQNNSLTKTPSKLKNSFYVVYAAREPSANYQYKDSIQSDQGTAGVDEGDFERILGIATFQCSKDFLG